MKLLLILLVLMAEFAVAEPAVAEPASQVEQHQLKIKVTNDAAFNEKYIVVSHDNPLHAAELLKTLDEDIQEISTFWYGQNIDLRDRLIVYLWPEPSGSAVRNLQGEIDHRIFGRYDEPNPERLGDDCGSITLSCDPSDYRNNLRHELAHLVNYHYAPEMPKEVDEQIARCYCTYDTQYQQPPIERLKEQAAHWSQVPKKPIPVINAIKGPLAK